MNEIQLEYNKQFEKQLKALCNTTIQALIDTYMFMFPAAYKYEDTNTYLFRYTFYAIRQRTVLSVRKLIEPSGKGKDKITIQSIVELATKQDFLFLSEKEKTALSADFDNLFNSEHTKRVKDFRNAFCHNIPDNDEVMCYYKDFMYIVNEAIHILGQLYTKVFNTIPTFFAETRNIAEFIAADYWESISKASGLSNNREDINARLDQLLNRKF